MLRPSFKHSRVRYSISTDFMIKRYNVDWKFAKVNKVFNLRDRRYVKTRLNELCYHGKANSRLDNSRRYFKYGKHAISYDKIIYKLWDKTWHCHPNRPKGKLIKDLK